MCIRDSFSIDINAPTEEYIDELMELRYSRIPVYEDDSDNIIGILHIKDYLIKAREEGFDLSLIHIFFIEYLATVRKFGIIKRVLPRQSVHTASRCSSAYDFVNN